MNLPLVGLVVVAAASSAAFAEPQAYVAPALEVGANQPQGGVFAGIALDGGYQLSGEWWAHGRGMYATSDNGAGDVRRPGHMDTVELGIEWRRYHVFAGADAAFVNDVTPGGGAAEYDAPALGLHAGLELGSEHWRFRPAFEALLGGKVSVPNTIVSGDYGLFGLSLGVEYRW